MGKFRENSFFDSRISHKSVNELLHVFYVFLYGLECNFTLGRWEILGAEKLVLSNVYISYIYLYLYI
jgi:hypothetical protein